MNTLSSLALLVPGILADNPYDSAPPDHFAVLAASFDRCANFHNNIPLAYLVR